MTESQWNKYRTVFYKIKSVTSTSFQCVNSLTARIMQWMHENDAGYDFFFNIHISLKWNICYSVERKHALTSIYRSTVQCAWCCKNFEKRGRRRETRASGQSKVAGWMTGGWQMWEKKPTMQAGIEVLVWGGLSSTHTGQNSFQCSLNNLTMLVKKKQVSEENIRNWEKDVTPWNEWCSNKKKKQKEKPCNNSAARTGRWLSLQSQEIEGRDMEADMRLR